MTLVEVTIASVIFAMIMLAVVTAMRAFAGTYDRLQAVIERTEQKREVDRFLRLILRDALVGPGYFHGAEREVRWVAPVDRAGSAAGIQHIRLKAYGGDLVISFAPFDREADSQEEPNWESAVESVALVKDLSDFQLLYRTQPEEGWSSSMEPANEGERDTVLPWGLQLRVETQDESWPPIIIAFEQFGTQG